MLSIPDMAILGAAALLFFGPEQLPRVMRKAGTVMREIQNTSQSFIREMERAADSHEPAGAHDAGSSYARTNGYAESGAYEPWSYDAATSEAAHEHGVTTESDVAGEGFRGGFGAPADSDQRPAPVYGDYEPPAPDPEPPLGAAPPRHDTVAEKLAEPRPALDFADAPTQPFDLTEAPTVMRPAVRPAPESAESEPFRS
ncbi:MAG TPA: twin-arginine translocase TatA/TatE family subunit [Candidatus Baltobacteraceae bacterium]|nr:twin-arginine translocase TatA/TatE family subunit [Candidatus Baltobacteraceae bacterium]